MIYIFYLEFSGLFYCSIIKLLSSVPACFLLTLFCVSEIYIITLFRSCQHFFQTFFNFFQKIFINSIEKLNSTPLWNLILQNVALLKVEFNSSYFSLIILYTNMVIPPSGKETIMNKQKHLNLEARILIETMLNEHHSFKSIARELGKDCTTISKEIKAHICFEKTGALGRSFNDCRVAFLHQCSLQKFCQHCAYSNNKPCLLYTSPSPRDA